MINWTQGNNFTNMPEDYYTVHADYGWFHVYAFTMTIGMILAIGVSGIIFWRKKIPIEGLFYGAMVIVPVSLFGASFLGKLNADGPGENANGVGFWGLFAFWQAGMSIHGGVYFGSFVGMVVFYFIGRKPRVSLWTYMDAIIPNILLGQAIGRWGNFFNHEVMGAPVGLASDNPLSWLPDWILKNTQVTYNGASGVNIGGIIMQHGEIYQMSPIFLYESLSLLASWAIIYFIIPGIGKWIWKKPWNVHKDEFNISVNDSFAYFFTRKEIYKQNSYINIWDEAYYNKNDATFSKEYSEKYNFYVQNKKDKLKLQEMFGTSNWLSIRWQIGVLLNKANNPDGYAVTKAGTQAGAYFFAWNFIRFFLEMQRPEDHLFIMYEKTASLVVIMLTALAGAAVMVLVNAVTPYLFRGPNYLYEKEFIIKDDLVAFKRSQKNNASKETVEDKKTTKKILKEQKAKEKLEKLRSK